MLNITRADAEKLVGRLTSAKASVKRAREKAEAYVDQVAQTAEVGTAAFALGMINGRWNGVEILGVPLDLIVAGGGHTLAFMGVAPTHLHNFADGALASYGTVLGAGIGRKMAVQAGGASSTGYLPGGGSGYAPLSDAQLADLASHA